MDKTLMNFDTWDVADALRLLQVSPLAGAWCLITVLDSSGDVATMADVLSPLARSRVDVQRVGRDIAVPLEQLKEELLEDLFTGFDEVWLCRSRPVSGKTLDVRITSDYEPSAVPRELAIWMDAEQCAIGLGDGVGLVVVGEPGAVAYLAA
jgi:hypothetical protein